MSENSSTHVYVYLVYHSSSDRPIILQDANDIKKKQSILPKDRKNNRRIIVKKIETKFNKLIKQLRQSHKKEECSFYDDLHQWSEEFTLRTIQDDHKRQWESQ